jgi:hypothetical protein
LAAEFDTLPRERKRELEAQFNAERLGKELATPSDPSATIEWSPFGLSSENFALCERALGTHVANLKAEFGGIGNQQVAEKVYATRADSSSVHRTVVLESTLAAHKINKKALSKSKKKDKTCLEMHPGICCKLGLGKISRITALHAPMQKQFQTWSEKHKKEGFLMLSVVGHVEEPEEMERACLGGFIRFVFFLSRVEMRRKFSMLTQMIELGDDSGPATCHFDDQCPMDAKLDEDSFKDLVQLTSWQLGEKLVNTDGISHWAICQLDYEDVVEDRMTIIGRTRSSPELVIRMAELFAIPKGLDESELAMAKVNRYLKKDMKATLDSPNEVSESDDAENDDHDDDLDSSGGNSRSESSFGVWDSSDDDAVEFKSHPTHEDIDAKVVIANGYKVKFGGREIGKITAWNTNISCQCLVHAKCRLPAKMIQNFDTDNVLINWLLCAVDMNAVDRLNREEHMAVEL